MLEPEMAKLLMDNVAIVISHLPQTMDEDDIHDFLGGGPLEWTKLSSPEALIALGWMDGVADAHDVTLLTLIDEVGIRIDKIARRLPRVRRRGAR